MSLATLFNPRTIAVIGASDDPTRIGGMPLRFLRQHGYSGKIFPVNPKYREIAGLPCYPSLADIAERIDLALIGIPRQLVFDAFRQCARKGVPFAILYSAGYAETGEGGRREQEELRAFAREAGLRVVGPNCIGIINTLDRVATSFVSGLEMEQLIPGSIALITQSGGIGNCILTRAQDRSIGLSFFISSGNELDLEVADFIEWIVRDGRSKAIALLMEGLKNPGKFSLAADTALQAGIPIVALKVGRSEMGRRAAASHTGAISGADRLYEGLFRQKGICRVGDIDDLFEVTHLLARHPSSGKNRLAILSSSGGSGALLADLASDFNIQLPAPAAQTRQKLHDLIPAVAAIANPMDITTQFVNDPEAIARYIGAFAEDENFDLVLLNLTVSTSDRSLRVAEKISAVSPALPKPLIILWPVGELARPAFRCLEQAGIPLFFQPSRCLAAIGHLALFNVQKKLGLSPHSSVKRVRGAKAKPQKVLPCCGAAVSRKRQKE